MSIETFIGMLQDNLAQIEVGDTLAGKGCMKIVFLQPLFLSEFAVDGDASFLWMVIL